jgi:hypothetical protein
MVPVRIVRPLKGMGSAIVAVVNWIDLKGPFVTAVATVAIAVLTGFYVHYSRAQWSVIRDQLPELQKSTKAAQDAAKYAQDALRQAREQFRQDERPYVWITNGGIGEPEFILDKNKSGETRTTGQIVWTVHYTNYGKSPAYDLTSDKFISVGAERPFLASFGSPKVKSGKGTPIPPNKDDFGTVVSEPGITPEQYKRLLGTDNAIRIRVQMQYTDAYGGLYETEICLGRLVSGAIQYCEGSYIK